MPGKPPLDLSVEIVPPTGGTYRWDSTGPAANIPRGLSFRTKRGEGFADASVTLARRIDQDYVDLNLYDDFNVIGADGSVAYEGRVGAMPRSMGDTHSLTVQVSGWMSHARDRKFREIYVDRDLSKWGGPSVTRKLAQVGAFTPTDPAVTRDGIEPALSTAFSGAFASTAKGASEAWYDAGGLPIGSLYYAWRKASNVDSVDVNWFWQALLQDDDAVGTNDTTVNLSATGPSTGTLTATAATRTFASVKHFYNAAGGADNAEYAIYWTCIAVYGNHGLTKRGSEDATTAKGLYASDVIKDIATRWCPKLNTAGVQDTNYVIAQIAYDTPTDPYDAFLDLNKYHLWDFAVWENKTLHYRPYDLTDYDWEVRLSDPGVAVDLQGDSTEQLANGIAVTFTDVSSGKQRWLTPDDYSELSDTSVENPANRAGLDDWENITITAPTTLDDALQVGRAALAEFNQPKGAGTISVRGHIRDRAGHWQPVWKVRAGDTIAVTDHPNDRPRLIVETDYSHDDYTLRVSTDSTAKRLDAFLDRVGTAIQINTLAP